MNFETANSFEVPAHIEERDEFSAEGSAKTDSAFNSLQSCAMPDQMIGDPK